MSTVKDKALIHLACEKEEFIPLLKSGVGEACDIIECGTGLIFKDGFLAVNEMKKLFPGKEVVADVKMTPLVVGHYGKAFFDQGADSVIITATKHKREMQPTMEISKKSGKKFYCLIEVEEDEGLDMDMLSMYKEVGVEYIIYHTIKTKAPYWREDDIEYVRAMTEMGFKVSVTGKLDVNSMKLFKGISIYSFVMGSSIVAADDPIGVVKEYRKIIDTL